MYIFLIISTIVALSRVIMLQIVHSIFYAKILIVIDKELDMLNLT